MDPDALLIGYIAGMMLLKAALIRRRTGLGRSMAACNLTLGLAFCWSLVGEVWPRWRNPDVLNAFRIAIAITVTWVVAELLREARTRWRLIN